MIEIYQIILIFSLIIFSSIFTVQYSNTLRLIEKLILLTITIISLIIFTNPWLREIISSFIKDTNEKELFILLYIPASLWGLVRGHIRVNRLNSRVNKLISEIARINPRHGNKL